MDAFTKAYNKMFKGENKEAKDLFNYNEVLNAWTLDPSILKKFVQS